MTTRPLAGLVLIALLGASPARADGETRPLAADIDFSKPPNQIEGYNKARITCTTEVRPEGRVFRVHGRAYYPDGVVFLVNLRYWKHGAPFIRARVEVKDRTFSAELGPFAKPIPGGELVAEAWFILGQQPKAIQKKLVDEKYMSCSPPCHFDRRNATRTTVDLGGQAAQEQDEKVEKEHVGRAVDAIALALRACEQVCLGVRQSKGKPEDAATALGQLQADVAAATGPITTWRMSRQFVLFPERFADVDALAAKALETGRLHAAVAGAKVEGLQSGGAAFSELATTLRETRERTDALKGFVAEQGTLDREWKKLNDDARTRWDEAQAEGAPEKTTSTPPARPGGR
jgi:hypothetical protein